MRLGVRPLSAAVSWGGRSFPARVGARALHVLPQEPSNNSASSALPSLWLENVGPGGILAPPCNCIIPTINCREQVILFFFNKSFLTCVPERCVSLQLLQRERMRVPSAWCPRLSRGRFALGAARLAARAQGGRAARWQADQDVFVVISCWFRVRGNSELALLDLRLGSWFEVWWQRSESLGERDQKMVSWRVLELLQELRKISFVVC